VYYYYIEEVVNSFQGNKTSTCRLQNQVVFSSRRRQITM